MKIQYFKLLFIELSLIAFSFFHFFFVRQFNQVYYIIELALILILLVFINRMDKKENYQKKEVTFIIIISVLIYYIVTYFFGFFLGFVYTTYSRSIMGIIRNVVISTLVILIIEYIRNIFISKGRYYKSIVFLCFILCTVFELLSLLSIVSFHDKRGILEIIMVIIIPCVFRNIFLTYCTYYFGMINSIIYHLLMVVISYIVPIFPDLGDYTNSILALLHPILVIIATSSSIFYKQDKISDTYLFKRYEIFSKYVYAVIILFLLLIVYFISDLGRYTILAIGSDSMHGSIDKGDIVLIDKKIRKYKEGEVIAFSYGGTLIVHRIVEVRDDQTYITKGDFNNGKDNWKVNEDMIKGVANLNIKYLGWPTVKLSEYLEKDD